MKIGDKLVNKTFAVSSNKSFKSEDLSGSKSIIYFYPKDDTPGCTKEAISFSEHKEKFEELDVKIFGVSKDNPEKHDKFKSKHNLTIELVSDEIGEICQSFGVWVEKSMYGKKYMGIERSTFLFDENLKLTKAWRNVKVKGHVEEVLSFIVNST